MNRETSWHERSEKVINRVNAAFPNPELFENWTICEELLLSATAAYQQINQFQIKTDHAVHIINKTSAYFHIVKADYPEALTLYQTALAINEQLYGTEHPVLVASCQQLAALYKTIATHTFGYTGYAKTLALGQA